MTSAANVIITASGGSHIEFFQRQGHSVDTHTGDFVNGLVLAIVSRLYVAAPIQPLRNLTFYHFI